MTVSGGTGFSWDTITPVDGARGGSEFKKASNSAYLAIAQIIDRYSIFQTSLTYQNQRGFLSHSYKQVGFELASGLPELPDNRPNLRHQVSWVANYRRHFRKLDGSLHLNGQYYYDSWKISALTLEGAWRQTLWDEIEIVPTFRYYSQSQAYFYSAVYQFVRADGYYTSDYRMSPFGALSLKLLGAWNFDLFGRDWRASLSYERYWSDAGYALGSVAIANPGLVDFDVVSIGLTGRF